MNKKVLKLADYVKVQLNQYILNMMTTDTI
jgi:hypothetical protein